MLKITQNYAKWFWLRIFWRQSLLMELLSDGRRIGFFDGVKLIYIRSGTLIPSNLIDFFNTSATTWENAIRNFNLAGSVSLKIGID